MSMTRNEFKQEAAIRCLQGLLAASGSHRDPVPHRDLADEAMTYADALTVAYGDAEPEAFFVPKEAQK